MDPNKSTQSQGNSSNHSATTIPVLIATIISIIVLAAAWGLDVDEVSQLENRRMQRVLGYLVTIFDTKVGGLSVGADVLYGGNIFLISLLIIRRGKWAGLGVALALCAGLVTSWLRSVVGSHGPNSDKSSFSIEWAVVVALWVLVPALLLALLFVVLSRLGRRTAIRSLRVGQLQGRHD